MPENYDRADYLKPSEVAALWGVTPQAVRHQIRIGRLPALRTPTGNYLIHKNDAQLRPARAG